MNALLESLTKAQAESVIEHVRRAGALIVVILDSQGRILDANRGLMQLLSLKELPRDRDISEWLRDVTVEQLLPPPEREEKRLSVSVQGGRMPGYRMDVNVIRTGEQFLLIGEKPIIADSTLVSEMSAISDELTNMTRQLRHKNQELEAAKKKIEQLARTDGLTGLTNRGEFLQSVDRVVSAARRHDRPVSAVLSDIDHFKGLNDTYGHQAGDAALKTFAEILRSTSRQEDIVARYGGEEFICLMADTDESAAAAYAERVRAALEAACLEGIDRPMTASFGVAQLRANESAEQLESRADKAMYHAKENGRNRVIRASELPARSA
jgi:diguanylate cyclase (GGDEF)-like protein